MSAQVTVYGTLKPDGTLKLDQQPHLSPGRVQVTVESVPEPIRPDRFWAMMAQIWADLNACGHIPRTVEEIEAERQAFRNDWEERQEALEQTHLEGERLRHQATQSREQSQ